MMTEQNEYSIVNYKCHHHHFCHRGGLINDNILDLKLAISPPSQNFPRKQVILSFEYIFHYSIIYRVI